MGRLVVVAEVAPDGALARISAEIATLARGLAAASGDQVGGLVVAREPATAATELARYLPAVEAVAVPELADQVGPQRIAAEVVRAAADADWFFVGASPDGRDVAGIAAARLGWGVLSNAMSVGWEDGAPVVAMSVFGGRLDTWSTFGEGRGIVTVRPTVVSAEPASSPGRVATAAGTAPEVGPAVRVLERVNAETTAAPIEEARVIVAGGRGVGGPEGFRVVEELAGVLGGAVGATRAAVDAGWIPYAQQIGQTGKIVKPQLYVALGISGAIQHKVGMQGSNVIVAINKDGNAPIFEFSDLGVVGDLHQVVPKLTELVKARTEH
jgi:electron transfer flavoprotein alpha subunit